MGFLPKTQQQEMLFIKPITNSDIICPYLSDIQKINALIREVHLLSDHTFHFWVHRSQSPKKFSKRENYSMALRAPRRTGTKIELELKPGTNGLTFINCSVQI